MKSWNRKKKSWRKFCLQIYEEPFDYNNDSDKDAITQNNDRDNEEITMNNDNDSDNETIVGSVFSSNLAKLVQQKSKKGK